MNVEKYGEVPFQIQKYSTLGDGMRGSLFMMSRCLKKVIEEFVIFLIVIG